VDAGSQYAIDSSRDALLATGGLILKIYLVVHTLGWISNWIRIHVYNRLVTNLCRDIKVKYFSHIVSLPHRFHASHNAGALISRISRGTSAVDSLLDIFVYNIVTTASSFMVILTSLAYFSPYTTVVVILTALVFVSFSMKLHKSREPFKIRSQLREDIELANVSDAMTNVDAIKYYGRESAIRKFFGYLTKLTQKAHVADYDTYRGIEVGQSMILAVGIIAVVWISLYDFMAGAITLGTLSFILAVLFQIVGQLFTIVTTIRRYYRTMAQLDSLTQYDDEFNEVIELPDAKELVIKDGTIEFKNITFAYDKRHNFRNFYLHVPKNKKVALVGHSGSGKSTLMKLLFRLYDVNKGAILVDGQDIRSVTKESLRSEIGIVPQDCILFDTTIYQNIKFADPTASRKDVMKAMRFAQLDKLVKSLPKKERTIVGERGVKLSGGEKQRVSIARAILANRKVLVLDEATSALDSETEYEIQRDLEKLMKNRTSIIIAHRLSTIMKADIIVVMKNGKIVQTGTHKQLIKKKGEYKKLWNLQKGGYIT